MGRFIEKENTKLCEKYYYMKHESGLPIYVIPKNHGTGYAIIATRFGSIDSKFSVGGETIDVPDGTAHFLEHKLFENEDGTDSFEKYAKVGASANAYTTLEKTAYLFSQSGNIEKALGILLDLVTHPYFTKENVEKEQGIIGQEIRMYEDNPNWRLYFNMLTSLYRDNTVKIDTAGTKETISHITPELLYKIYGAFYNLNNMALCVCADIDPEAVAKIADEYLEKAPDINVERYYPDEQKEVARVRSEQKLHVSMPMFSVGVKDPDLPSSNGAFFKKQTEYEIILELLFGKMTDFYSANYESGLINSAFSYGYEGYTNFGHCEISGYTKDPDGIFEKIKERIADVRKNGFDKEDFETVKRAFYASNIREFNSTENIANEFLKYIFSGSDMLDYPDIINSVTFEDVKRRFESSFADEYLALSAILPD